MIFSVHCSDDQGAGYEGSYSHLELAEAHAEAIIRALESEPKGRVFIVVHNSKAE